MTRALPFTEASIARRIKGVEKSGWYPIGVTADGTVLIGEKPLATASLVQQMRNSLPHRQGGLGRGSMVLRVKMAGLKVYEARGAWYVYRRETARH